MRDRRAALFYAVIAVFLATAAVTLLGVTGTLAIRDRYLDVLFATLVVELATVVVGLFRANAWFGSGAVPSRVAEIAGDWWQVGRSDGDDMIAFVRIGFAADRGEIVLDGDAFATDGSSVTDFHLYAGFISDDGALHFLWRGGHPGADGQFAGVGHARFDPPDPETKTQAGTGWYTIGDIEKGLVEERREVTYIRADEEESEIMDVDDDPEARRAAVKTRLDRLRSDG